MMKELAGHSRRLATRLLGSGSVEGTAGMSSASARNIVRAIVRGITTGHPSTTRATRGLLLALMLLFGLAVLSSADLRAAEAVCSGVSINPGEDLDATVNRDPGNKATTFCVQAAVSGTTYTVNRTIELGPGDKLLGPPGKVVARGPASYGVPTAKIRGGKSLEKVIQLRGQNQVKWLDISGGEMGIAASQATPSTLLAYLTVHHTSRTGITSMNGRLMHSNLHHNGTDRRWWGHSAAAVKGQAEYEAAYNYIHDNPANGLWCDVGCRDQGSAMPNGFWAHDNLLVENGRWGVRYESSPLLPSGERSNDSTALVEDNAIHGNGYRGKNGYGGASMWDAQNAIFRANSFGSKTIAGESYSKNAGRRARAILFFDSGQAHRTDLWNGQALDNSLGGERIDGCTEPDRVVLCSNNT